jgi:DNA polymerase-3 subunit alpha
MDFVNLHLHTHNSLMDGVIKIPELVAEVKRLGQNAVAVTDHGNLSCAIELYSEAKKLDVKPIIGIEAYFVPDIADKKCRRTHITLIAMNNDGLKNLYRLTTYANEHGFHYKPRMDYTALEKWNDGIICLSGCLGSLLAQAVVHDEHDEFKKHFEKLLCIFGDRFYLELQDSGIEEQKKVLEFYRSWSTDTKVPTVCTNDAHYLLSSDSFAQEVMVTMLQNKTILDPVREYNDSASKGRYKFSGDGYYLGSAEDMIKKFSSDEINMSQYIADMCNIVIDFDQFRVPKFDTGGRDSFEVLSELCHKGWKKFQLNLRPNVETYRQRIKHELKVICDANLSDYFLIVADLNNFCNKQDIPVGPGRGSAAGCLISYLTGITKVDPVKYDLIFERFFNVGRSNAIGYNYDEYSFEKFCKDRTTN